jgi:hypothetical protein
VASNVAARAPVWCRTMPVGSPVALATTFVASVPPTRSVYVASSDGTLAEAAYVTMRSFAPGSTRRTFICCGSEVMFAPMRCSRAPSTISALACAPTGALAPARTSMCEPSVTPSVDCAGTGAYLIAPPIGSLRASASPSKSPPSVVIAEPAPVTFLTRSSVVSASLPSSGSVAVAFQLFGARLSRAS